MNTSISTEIKNTLELAKRLQESMQGSFPTYLFGTKEYIEKSNNPNVQVEARHSLHILNGALVVYLFSMWDAHMKQDSVEKYFRPNERLRFYAFKHIRIVAAHNIDGSRAGNRKGQDRMDHYKAFDEIMLSANPFEGLPYDNDSINLGDSNIALDCL